MYTFIKNKNRALTSKIKIKIKIHLLPLLPPLLPFLSIAFVS